MNRVFECHQKSLNIVVIFIFCFIFLSAFKVDAQVLYPLNLQIVEKNDAAYDTPENAYISLLSAMFFDDLEWYYESNTIESVEREKLLITEHGYNPLESFERVKNINKITIVNKIEYRNGVALIVEIQKEDGSFIQGPSIFNKEGGVWKCNSDIPADDPILDYLYYVPPLFYGKGQNPAEVNSFLGYSYPTAHITDIASDINKVKIHIYYGRSIVAESFSATLNKEDITLQFAPIPLTNEEVEISLQKGRNVLIFSVEGIKKSGKSATDIDRLVFVVP